MASKIVVAGVASLAINVGVQDPTRITKEGPWYPRWLESGVGGAGGHISTILSGLGDDVSLCTVVGGDRTGALIRRELDDRNLNGPEVVEGASSALAVVLVAPSGDRVVYSHMTSIAAVQYPVETFQEAVRGADLAVLTSIDFTRPLLPAAVLQGVPIAVDVNVIADIDDDRYGPWLEVADIVFCSHERLPCPAEEWIAQVFRRYPGCLLTAVSRGGRGCLLGLRDGRLVQADAVAPLGVCNTSSAGDSLFASFLHSWLATGNPVEALSDAVVYAGWRIGHRFPSGVLLGEADLANLRSRNPVRVKLSRWDRTQPAPASP
ncbi:carbohydrate kinase family protein [Saccharopolyspora sp. NPDC050642]|uniref:carbohydrate kinase family protein n=1 Tax=Saccharopolyspora sp. NPDC050642 TaxID=3157099 RepID=UPI0033FBD72D